MDTFSVEATVHRIGGTDRYERTFMPTVFTVYPGPGGRASVNLQGLLFANALTRLDVDRVQLVRAGLWSAEVRLSDVNAYPIAPPRPVLISTMPTDVPLYSTHVATDPEHGVYSVGLRIPRSSWAPEHLAPDTLADDGPVHHTEE